METECGSSVGSVDVKRASASPLLVLAVIVAGASAGCATASYRVPGLEVQRLAKLSPEERGTDVRVVPQNAPLYPSTQRPEPIVVSPPVVAPPPGPPVYGPSPEVVVVEEQPAVVTGPDVYLDVTVPVGGGHPHSHGAPSPHVIEGRPPLRAAPRPASSGFKGMPVSGGGGLRGSPPVTSAPHLSGWRGSPVGSAPRMSTPSHTSIPTRSFGGSHSSGGGHSHSSGGGDAGAVIAVVAVLIVVVALVALVAVAADHAAKADRARKFDGWVNVNPGHPLRLHYSNNTERIVPLSQLQPSDTIGLQYGVLSGNDGDVQMRPPSPVPARTVAPAAPALNYTPAAPAPNYTPAAPPPYAPVPPAAAAQPTS